MSRISEDNRRDGARVAEWIAVVGRQPATAVAVHFGFPLFYAQKCLRAALLDGRLAKVRIGPTFLWMQPIDEPKFRAEQRKTRNKTRSAYGLARYQRLRSAGVIDHKGAMLDPEHWPVVQRTVPAIGAKPVMTRAPASVFHLGAMG